MTIDMIAKKYNLKKKIKINLVMYLKEQLSNEKIFALKPKDL